MNVKCILMSLFVWASTVQAQTYYYYKGKKIGIALDSTKCTVFRDTPPSLLRSAGRDIGKNWNVVEKDSIKILQARNSSLPSDILAIEPVLFPSETPVSRLFYVKLKSECDTLFLKTRKMAARWNVRWNKCRCGMPCPLHSILPEIR